MPPFDDSIARRRQRIMDLLFTHEAGSDLLYGDRDPEFKTRWAARFRAVAREAAAAAQEIDPRPESEPDPLKDIFR